MDAEDIDRLIDAITSTYHIPVEYDLWSMTTIAKYFKCSVETARQKVTCQPDFPKRIKIKAPGDGYMKPLWRAKDVIAWGQKWAR